VLRLDSASAATVLRGKVVFHGDETAAPFDLRTPSATLVDLGTEYAVAVTADGEEVHVFDGQVRRLTGAGASAAELLRAGEARAYGPSPESPGRRMPLDPGRFVRRLADLGPAAADPGAGLLAYEGFDYADPAALPAGQANGGVGWASPWRPGFARPLNPGDRNLLALNVREGLTRPGAATPSRGGCFDYTGFTKYFRRMAVPVRLDADGVYYLSLLFRRQGPPADPLNCVAVLLRNSDELENELGGGTPDPHKRLNVGVGGTNELFTHLHGVGSRTPLPLSYGTTYLLLAKIVASRSHPDQVFLRVYAPDEPVEADEPGGWSVTGPPFQSDLVFDWLEVHINSKTRQTMDELRVGTTWASVTAPWVGKGGRPSP
jgi:FecR protein